VPTVREITGDNEGYLTQDPQCPEGSIIRVTGRYADHIECAHFFTGLTAK
jgi:hypothetical protein